MSGIYIPRMEIPKEKGSHKIKITLFVREDGTAGLWGTEIYIPHEPLTLIPVPDHGRLIDADAFLDDLLFPSKQFEYGLMEMIGDAPTIIPADKEVFNGT